MAAVHSAVPIASSGTKYGVVSHTREVARVMAVK